jgi:hypothetical protein
MLSEKLGRRDEELQLVAEALEDSKADVAKREDRIAGHAAELDARDVSLCAKEALVRQHERSLDVRVQKLDEHETRLTECAAMLQTRDADIEERSSRVRENEAAATRRAEEIVVVFAALEQQKKDWMKASDEHAAANVARLRAWEEQLGCTEALLAEREDEVRHGAEQIRVATADLEEQQRAVASLEAILTERAVPSRPAPAQQVAPFVASETIEVAAEPHKAPAYSLPEVVEALNPSPARRQRLATEAPVNVEVPPSVDISDLSVEEIEQFNTRRRLGLRNDATIAAEIRSERVSAKKKGWWF